MGKQIIQKQILGYPSFHLNSAIQVRAADVHQHYRGVKAITILIALLLSVDGN